MTILAGECGDVAVASSNCIALSGTGVTESPLVASPIIDPSEGNNLLCTATGLRAPCQADLAVDGGVGPGSLTPLTADVVGLDPFLTHPCTTIQDLYGPQADLLISNPTDCSFDLAVGIISTDCVWSLDPGTDFAVGWIFRTWPVNTAPSTIPFTLGTVYYGGERVLNTTGSVQCGITTNKTFLPLRSGSVLTPGDFLWVSLQAVAYVLGAAVTTIIAPVVGQGPVATVRGVRL